MIEPFSEKQAEEIHASGDGYTVVVGGSNCPVCFIEIAIYPRLVSFLDSCRQPYLSYDFEESSLKGLFLMQIVEVKFVEGTSRGKEDVTYQFSRDGNVNIYRKTYYQEGKEARRGLYRLESTTAKADVSHFYFKKPPFGEYDDFIRQREIKIIPGTVKPLILPSSP